LRSRDSPRTPTEGFTVPHLGARGMKCYYCGGEPHAVCKFCGAMVCPQHTAAKRYVSGQASAGAHGWAEMPRWYYDYVTVDNAIWCRRCAVRSFRNE